MYTYILNNEYNYNIEKITIVYFTRDLKSVYPFDLDYNEKKAKSLLENAITLRNCIISKKVPEPIQSSNEQCKYCLYLSFCVKDKSKMIPPYNNKFNNETINTKYSSSFVF